MTPIARRRAPTWSPLRRALLAAGLLWATPALAQPAEPPKPATVAELVARLSACESLDGCAPLHALIARGDAVWPELEIGLKAPDEMTRFWTLGVLHERPLAAAREAVTTCLDDKMPRIRAAAAMALGQLADKAVTPALIKAAADKDVNVRYAAVYAMGIVKDPASLDALTRALRDADEDVRAHAAQSLAELADKQAAPALLERVQQDLIGPVRGHAVIALARLGERSVAPALVAHLGAEKDPKVLAATAHAVGQLGAPTDIPALEKLLTHPDAQVVEYVRAAIAALRPPAPPTTP